MRLTVNSISERKDVMGCVEQMVDLGYRDVLETKTRTKKGAGWGCRGVKENRKRRPRCFTTLKLANVILTQGPARSRERLGRFQLLTKLFLVARGSDAASAPITHGTLVSCFRLVSQQYRLFLCPILDGVRNYGHATGHSPGVEATHLFVGPFGHQTAGRNSHRLTPCLASSATRQALNDSGNRNRNNGSQR